MSKVPVISFTSEETVYTLNKKWYLNSWLCHLVLKNIIQTDLNGPFKLISPKGKKNGKK